MDMPLGSILGKHGGGFLVQALNQTWTMIPIVQQGKDQFTALLKLRARQSVIEQKPHLPLDDYREALAAVSSDIAAGRYDWGGQVMRAAGNSDWGIVTLGWLMLQAKHPDITIEKALEISEANRDGFLAAYFDALRAGSPNLFAPAKEAPAEKTTTA